MFCKNALALAEIWNGSAYVELRRHPISERVIGRPYRGRQAEFGAVRRGDGVAVEPLARRLCNFRWFITDGRAG